MSRPLTVNIPHQLGREEARRRVEAGFGDLSRRLGGLGEVSKQWDGDRMNFGFHAMGQAITGAVDVAEQSVRLELVLPGLLGMMAGRLKGRLQQEGQLLLDKK